MAGVLAGALVASRQDVREAPDRITETRELGVALLAEGRFAEALPVLRTATGLNPYDPYLWLHLGRAAARSGDPEQAVAALEHARRLGAFSPANLALEIARVHAGAGHRAEALRWIQQSLDDGRCCRSDLFETPDFSAFRDDPEFRRLAGAQADGLDRDARWIADLDYFVEEARRMHVGPDRPAHAPAFDARAALVRQGIPGWSDTRVAAELVRLSVMLGDGHSGLSLSSAGTSPTKLPIDLYQFAEGVFVVGGSEAGGLVGRRVVRLGGRPVLDVLGDLAVFVARDNAQGLKAAAGSALTTVPYLATIGAVSDDGSVRVEVEDDAGQVDARDLVAGPWRRSPRLPVPSGVGEPPRYLRDGPPFWTERLPGVPAIYVNFSAVADGPTETLAAFADRLAVELDRDGIRTVVVDTRMNGGGNTFLVNRLARALIHFDRDDPANEIYVLIGRHTFSAAQNFIAAMDQWTDATFVGEPSGSRMNFTGESSSVRLPYSGMAGTISTRNHQNADWEDRRVWIAPDILVEPSAADYFAGRDAALDAVLRRLR